MKIKVTVEVNGENVMRIYHQENESSEDIWGKRIIDMLDTLAKSEVKEF